VVPLANALQEEKWSLVQPLLSSSYIGYGTSSLKEVQASFGWNIFYIMGITRMFSLRRKNRYNPRVIWSESEYEEWSSSLSNQVEMRKHE
jgi:hypothetical protein